MWARQELSSVLRLRHPFIKDVVTLFSGKAAAGLAGLIFAPIIARFFEPEHFGVAALFVSIIVVLGPVVTLCYDQAIILPESDEVAGRLMALALIISGGLVTLVLFVILVLQVTLGTYPIAEQLGSLIWGVPVGAALLAFVSIAENWQIRQKSFSVLAKADITQAVTTPGMRIILAAAYGSSVWGLISGYFVGLVVKLRLLSRSVLANIKVRTTSSNASSLRLLAEEYKDFPLSNAPARFARAFSNQLPVIVLGFIFFPVTVGVYAMAYRLIAMPGEAVANSVRRVFLQRSAARLNRQESLHSFFLKTTLGMALLGFLPLLILWLFADRGVVVLLGERWADVAQFAKLLGIWYFFVWMTVPSSAMFIVLRRQNLWLKIQLWLAALRVVFLYGAYLLQATSEEMVASFVIAGVLVNSGVITFMIWRTRVIGGEENDA